MCSGRYGSLYNSFFWLRDTLTLESNLHMLSVGLPAGLFLSAAGENWPQYEFIDKMG